MKTDSNDNDENDGQSAFQTRHYSAGEIVRYMWPLLRPFRGRMLIAASLISLVGLAVAIVPLYPKYIIDMVIPQRSLKLAFIASGIFLAFQLMRMLMWYIGMCQISWINESMLFALRLKGFQHLQNLCLRFHSRYSSGFLYEQVFGRSINGLGIFFVSVFNQLVVYVAGLVFSLAFCFYMNPAMTGLILCGAVAYMAAAHKLSPTIHAKTKETINRANEIAQYIMDKLRGTKTIQAFAMQEHVTDAFHEHIWRLQKTCYESNLQTLKLGFLTEGIGYALNVIIMISGAIAIFGYNMKIGTLVAFLSYEGMFIGLLSACANMYGQFSAARAGFDQLFTVLDTQSTIVSRPGAIMPAEPIIGNIEFRNVTFSYSSKPVLSNVGFLIPPGQTVALVGRSGAGKTTIANLLLRFFDPDAGAILLDGRDIRDLPLREYRSLYGIVLQDPFLFDDTIVNNLRCARHDASEAEITEALAKACALDFVREFPDGLNHRVGEGGAQLSGGQRQRIAIARCMLLKSRFVILDESTSALDNETERSIQHSIEALFEGRTVFVIAHRLSTIRKADRILVFDAGRLVEDGSFDDLMAAGKMFHRFYSIATSSSSKSLKIEEAGFA